MHFCSDSCPKLENVNWLKENVSLEIRDIDKEDLPRVRSSSLEVFL